MDIFQKCYAYTRAAEARAAGFYPYFIPLEDTEGTEVVIHGKRMIIQLTIYPILLPFRVSLRCDVNPQSGVGRGVSH